jgi:PAS domain-containing protein
MAQIIWIAAADGSRTDFNPHWYEYTGFSEAESLGWEFLKAIHSEGVRGQGSGIRDQGSGIRVQASGVRGQGGRRGRGKQKGSGSNISLYLAKVRDVPLKSLTLQASEQVLIKHVIHVLCVDGTISYTIPAAKTRRGVRAQGSGLREIPTLKSRGSGN